MSHPNVRGETETADKSFPVSSAFLRVLGERGFLHNCSNKADLDKRLCEEVVVGYIGFDATADSLHVGSLVQLMMLRWLQKTGHRPIVILGHGTTLVGDPSGKHGERPLLTKETIARNANSLQRVFHRFLSFAKTDSASSTLPALLLDNAPWLAEAKLLPFLRDYGRHFSVNRMVKFDSVRTRLESDSPLSFLEFSYMLLQSYDFLKLYEEHGCRLQMGGSDQWSNILCGADLLRRVHGEQGFALTSPLLTTHSGQKMGKTAEGAVWLDERKTSVSDFWQYWRNSADEDVGRFLRLFTELPLFEIERLEALQGQERNKAKKVLATEVTALCHGREEAESAARAAESIFERGEHSQLPIHTLESNKSLFLYEILRAAELAPSNSAARRLIAGGGVRLGTSRGEQTTLREETHALTLKPGERLVLSLGKKRHCTLVGSAAD